MKFNQKNMAKTVRAMERFGDVMRGAQGESARRVEKAAVSARISAEAVDALSAYLINRDWPNSTPREISVHHRAHYDRMAAAILNSEAWAIKEAFPDALPEIYGTRPATV